MNVSKIIFSENICPSYEFLTLSPEAQEYLETDVMAMIHKCLHDKGKGLPYTEMVQECLISATQAMLRFDPTRHATKQSTYIYESFENRILMEKRRLCSDKARAAHAEVNYDSYERTCAYDFDDFIEWKDKSAWLDKVINDPATGLDDDERQVLQLTRQGLEQKEIGKAIGHSQSFVSIRKTRGIEKITARMHRDMEDRKGNH